MEMSLYKHAIVSKGSDAQQLLKASIEDMMVLKSENEKLKEEFIGNNKQFEQRYCSPSTPNL